MWYKATGTADGSSWNNAWISPLQIQFGSGAGKVGPGDTLWIAGGFYTDQFTPSAAFGTPASPILIRRVRSTDSTPVASPGWQPSFDSQVILSNDAALPPLEFNSVVSNMCFDGRVNEGILMVGPNNGGSSIKFDLGVDRIQLRNIYCRGPGWQGGSFTYSGDCRGIEFTQGSGVNWKSVVSNCTINGFVNLIWAVAQDTTIENCRFLNNDAANSVTFHCNVVISSQSRGINQPFIFRYNDISNYTVEGIMFIDNTPQTNWQVYGNAWHDSPAGSVTRIWESQDCTNGWCYFYNNTMVGINHDGLTTANGGLWTNCLASNNLWATSVELYANGWTRGSNVNSGSVTNYFLSPISGNYNLKTNQGPNLPRGAGVSIAGTFTKDYNGNTFSAVSGKWDAGAFSDTNGAAGPTVLTPVGYVNTLNVGTMNVLQ